MEINEQLSIDEIELALREIKRIGSNGIDKNAYDIIISMLEWLGKYIKKETVLNGRLKKIELGVLALKEVEAVDEGVAELLYKIQYKVEKIRGSD